MSHENTVELIGYYGSDLTHALSAWTSTSRDLSEDKLSRVPKLLKMLAENKHHTPFEKSAIHFLCTTDLATHIQLLKHRIGVSINSESARYKELKDDKYYLPDDWDNEDLEILDQHCQDSLKKYHEAIDRLVSKGVPRKRAKESARFFLPYSHQYRCDVMFNFRSFMHFVGLRNKPDAQKEIVDLSSNMLKCVKDLNCFKNSLEAFGY